MMIESAVLFKAAFIAAGGNERSVIKLYYACEFSVFSKGHCDTGFEGRAVGLCADCEHIASQIDESARDTLLQKEFL